MRAVKKDRLEKKLVKAQDKGEAAFFAGEDKKARRNLKKSMQIGNKLNGTNNKPAVPDKEFRKLR
jgi:hypothetical protein